MIQCDDARHRWNRRLDDGIDDAELLSHLSSCEACRSYADQIGRIVAALDELKDASESVVATGTSATETRPAPGAPPLVIRLSRLMRAAAVLALVASAAFYFVGRRANHTQIVPPAPPTVVVGGPSIQYKLGLTLRDKSAERMMAVAMPTSNPDVQMYRLYRTVGAKERGPS